MKKLIKSNTFLLIISCVLVVLSMLLINILKDYSLETKIGYLVIFATILGLTLYRSNNDITKRIGLSLLLYSFAKVAYTLFNCLVSSNYSEDSVIIVWIVAIVFFAINRLLVLIAKIISKDLNKADVNELKKKASLLEEWQHLKELGIISDIECEVKRKEILDLPEE